MLSIGWDWGALGIFREIRTVTRYLWGKGKLRYNPIKDCLPNPRRTVKNCVLLNTRHATTEF